MVKIRKLSIVILSVFCFISFGQAMDGDSKEYIHVNPAKMKELRDTMSNYSELRVFIPIGWGLDPKVVSFPGSAFTRAGFPIPQNTDIYHSLFSNLTTEDLSALKVLDLQLQLSSRDATLIEQAATPWIHILSHAQNLQSVILSFNLEKDLRVYLNRDITTIDCQGRPQMTENVALLPKDVEGLKSKYRELGYQVK